MTAASLGIVETLVAATRAGVTVVVLRDDPKGLELINEIDVLVDPADLTKLIGIAGDLGWCAQDMAAFIPRKVSLVRYHAGRLLKLDVHLEFIDGPHIYMSRRMAMSRIRAGEFGLNYLSREDWIIHVVLHTVLGKPAISGKYVERLQQAIELDIDRAYLQAQLKQYGATFFAPHIGPGIVEFLRSRESVAASRRRMRWRLRLNLGNLLRELSFHFYWSAGRLLGLRPGLSIAFIGPDGAGKTTTIAAFCDALRAMEVPTRMAYMGPWERSVFPTRLIVRHFGFSPLEPVPEGATGLKLQVKRAKVFVKRQLFYLHIFLDAWARYFLKVWPHTRLRRVVLWDRSMADLQVGYYNTPIPHAVAQRRWIFRLAPKPAITIVLDNEAEEIWARKKEFSLDLIRTSLAKYRELARVNGYVLLRTDRASADLVDEFMRQNWREFAIRRRDRSFLPPLCSPIVARVRRVVASLAQARRGD